MEDIKAQWNKVPENFSMGEDMSLEIKEEIIPLFLAQEFTDGKLLDIGCWDGRNTIPLAISDYFEEVWGVDITGFAQSKLENLRKLSRSIPSLKIAQMNEGEDLPFVDEYFDFVLAWRIAHNILGKKERLNFFKQALRVLSKRGLFAVCVRKSSETESYIHYLDMGTMHLSQRFPGDIIRLYYKNFEDLEIEIAGDSRIEVIQRLVFDEYEYKDVDGILNRDIIPCLGVVVKK